MRVLLALLLPMLVVEYAVFALAFKYSATTCSGKNFITALYIVVLAGPPALYFMLDRRITRGHFGSVFVRTVVVTFIALIPIAIAVPSMLTAPQWSRQKLTLERMRQISGALRSYAQTNNRYPTARNITELRRALPVVAEPLVDGWCAPFAIVSGGDHYEILSLGRDRKPDALRQGGPTQNFDDDIVLRDGALFQYPSGAQP